jgi:hypothetical protein
LPEDDANREIVNGFLLEPGINLRKLQPLPAAGGWKKVIEKFADNYVSYLRKHRTGTMILLVDFDDRENRLELIRAAIPGDLSDRVFVLGTKTEPEDLQRRPKDYKKERLGSLENVGRMLAQDCVDGTDTAWSHDLLAHNAEELKRLIPHVQSFLFV